MYLQHELKFDLLLQCTVLSKIQFCLQLMCCFIVVWQLSLSVTFVPETEVHDCRVVVYNKDSILPLRGSTG